MSFTPSDSLNETTEAIRRFKREYWTQEGIGAEYQYMAHQPEPFTRVKNIVEISLILKHVKGPRVLDAGAGTGRITLPLFRRKVRPIALDISREMLRQGRRTFSKMGRRFPAILGDVERLPFPDAMFDSVVSITVLRHFPNWRAIAWEYLRVVRPGGRVIFDMGSGEQRGFLEGQRESRGARAQAKDARDPFAFDVGLTASELDAFAEESGVSVVAAMPYDFFNANPLMERCLGDNWLRVKEQLACFLEKTNVVVACEIIARRFLSVLSPALCPSWLIVLEKTDVPRKREAPIDGTKANESEEMISGELLRKILSQKLGREFESSLAELREMLSDRDVMAFLDFCRTEIALRIPAGALTRGISSS